MPMQKKSEPNTPKKSRRGRVVKHTLVDGTVKIYSYEKYSRKGDDGTDTLRSLVKAYQNSHEWNSLAEKTKKNRIIYLDPLLKAGGSRPYVEVSKRDLITARDSMVEPRGVAASNEFIKATRVLYNWAMDKEMVTFNPTYKIKYIEGGSIKAWTRSQADEAELRLPDRLSKAVILARYTAQRRGDLCKMRWDDIVDGFLAVTQEKTGAVLVIPLHPILQSHLKNWPRVADTILTDFYGKSWDDPDALTAAMNRSLDKIKMPDDLSIHGLRKLASAELADAGCTTHMIQSITGHVTLKEVERYTRSADQKKLAIEAIMRLSKQDYKLQTKPENTN